MKKVSVLKSLVIIAITAAAVHAEAGWFTWSKPVAELKIVNVFPFQKKVYTFMDDGTVKLSTTLDGITNKKGEAPEISGEYTKRISPELLQDIRIEAILLKEVKMEPTNEKDICLDGNLYVYSIFNRGVKQKVLQSLGCKKFQGPTKPQLRNVAKSLAKSLDKALNEVIKN